MIYPNKLSKDMVIGVTATSSGVSGEKTIQIDTAYETLKKFRYHKIIETPNVRTNEKFVSSTPFERAQQFMELWKNDNVGLVANVRGGEFLIECIPYIDKKIFSKFTPKWITGYSDTSLLNFYITTNFNIATATCANILHFSRLPLHRSLTDQLKMLQTCTAFIQKSFDKFELPNNHDTIKPEPYNLTEKVLYKSLQGRKSEKFSGRIIGGCIDTISQLLGTPYDNTKKFVATFSEGMLWYLENCELTLLELKRRLFQMKLSGWFKNANGILIGRTKIEKTIADLSYEDVLHDIFDDLHVPVIYDCDFGHVPPQWTMINGAIGEFEFKNGKGKLTTKFI